MENVFDALKLSSYLGDHMCNLICGHFDVIKDYTGGWHLKTKQKQKQKKLSSEVINFHK